MGDTWKKKDVVLPNLALNVYRGEGVLRGEGEPPIEPMDISPESGQGREQIDPETAALILALRRIHKANR